MTRSVQFTFILALSAALCAPTAAASAKKVKRIPAPITYPASFNVGQMQMTGRRFTNGSFSIGTLQLTGQRHLLGSFPVGTLTMTGNAYRTAIYMIGTLEMTGNLAPAKQTSTQD